MDQRSTLHGVSVRFLAQIVTRQPPEFFIDQRCKPQQRFGFSPAPFGQERGNAFVAHPFDLPTAWVESIRIPFPNRPERPRHPAPERRSPASFSDTLPPSAMVNWKAFQSDHVSASSTFMQVIEPFWGAYEQCLANGIDGY
jgi:hypothetical protein